MEEIKQWWNNLSDVEQEILFKKYFPEIPLMSGFFWDEIKSIWENENNLI